MILRITGESVQMPSSQRVEMLYIDDDGDMMVRMCGTGDKKIVSMNNILQIELDTDHDLKVQQYKPRRSVSIERDNINWPWGDIYGHLNKFENGHVAPEGSSVKLSTISTALPIDQLTAIKGITFAEEIE